MFSYVPLFGEYHNIKNRTLQKPSEVEGRLWNTTENLENTKVPGEDQAGPRSACCKQTKRNTALEIYILLYICSLFFSGVNTQKIAKRRIWVASRDMLNVCLEILPLSKSNKQRKYKKAEEKQRNSMNKLYFVIPRPTRKVDHTLCYFCNYWHCVTVVVLPALCYCCCVAVVITCVVLLL